MDHLAYENGVEWFRWATEEGWLTLSDGRRVFVRNGDLLLGREGDGCVRFFEHSPKVIH